MSDCTFQETRRLYEKNNQFTSTRYLFAVKYVQSLCRSLTVCNTVLFIAMFSEQYRTTGRYKLDNFIGTIRRYCHKKQ